MTRGRESSEGFDIQIALDQLTSARDAAQLIDGPSSRKLAASINADITSITENPVLERAFRLSGRVALDNTTQGE